MGIRKGIGLSIMLIGLFSLHAEGERFKAAVLEDFPPLYRLDSHGQPIGLAIDILGEVSRKAGFSVDYVVVKNWGEATDALRTRKADFVPGIGIEQLKADEFSFSAVPMETVPVSIFVRKGMIGIEGRNDLGGHRTAVLRDGAAWAALRSDPRIDLVIQETTDAAILALLAGDVDAFVCPEPMLQSKLSELRLSDRFRVAGGPLLELKRGYLFRREDEAFLRERIDPALKDILSSATYQSLYQEWYGEPLPFFTPQRILLAAGISIASLLLCFFGIWGFTIGRKNRELAARLAFQKSAEAALRESEERYRALFENAPLGIALETGKDHLIRLVNEPFSRLFGYGQDDLGRLRASDCHPPGDEGMRREEMENARYGMTNELTAMPCLRKDGSVFFCDIVATQITMGVERGTVAFFQDVTERERNREELRQSEKLSAIGQLAGGIAHDYNNQLAGILGYAELLAARLEGRSEESRMVEAIISAVRRSADITRQLLAFARKGKFEEQPVDLKALALEVVALASHSIDKRIRIVTDFCFDRVCAKGDSSQLQNALLNVVINARDAMPSGGLLRIAIDAVELPSALQSAPGPGLEPGTYSRILVEDSGCGIPPELLPRVFEPFFTTKAPGKGTGMGLPAVYGTVKNHGGWVGIESEEGKGTKVTILLPAISECPEGEREPAPTPELRKAGRNRVLFVDDEPMIRDAGKAILEEAGYDVALASDGQEALEYFTNHRGAVDLVILDILMPGMDGHGAFREMRAVDPSIRILVISGFSMDGEAQALLDSGACGFLHKPFRRSDLLASVESARPGAPDLDN